MPHNPLEGPTESLPPEAPLAETTVDADAAGSGQTLLSSTSVEDPPWSLLDVFVLGAISLFTLFVSWAGLSLLAYVYFGRRVPWVRLAPRPEVVVLAQILGYIVVFALMVRFARTRAGSAAVALKWNWPRNWLAFLGYGVSLAIVLQLFGHLLPMPKSVPMDEFFRTTRMAWLVSILAVVFAPLIEELFFRGFLYPVMARLAGMTIGIAVTGLAFGAIHLAQLKYSWGPDLIIIMVGIVLSAVRAYRKSVASTFLMHVGYNLTVTMALFIDTDGFRHLDKLRS